MLSALRFPKPSANPRLPDGVRIYAINDIHGCAHLLERMLAVIDADVAHSRPYRAIEVFLGDYIDRGPDSRSTLDLLIRRARGGNAVFLKGNHEAFLAEVFLDPSRISDWFRLGARPHAGSQCGDFGKPGQHRHGGLRNRKSDIAVD